MMNSPVWYQLPNRGAETRARRAKLGSCALCGAGARAKCNGNRLDGTKCGLPLCGAHADRTVHGEYFCPDCSSKLAREA